MRVGPDEIVAATVACASVAAMASGVAGEVATYLPGRRVPGVRIDDLGIEVHVVARWGIPLPEVGEEVRSALQPLVGNRSVSVFIDDVETTEVSDA